MPELLKVRDLTVRYGAVTAVNAFAVDVPSGSIVGLIGPNGAGKTSLVDALTGFTKSSGSIQLKGREISKMPAHKRANLGMGRAWQSVELFDDLTVEENLRVSMVVSESDDDREAASDRLLGSVGLDVDRDLLPTQLSQGQRKLLGLARSLASNPSVLLADEPAAGLDTTESRALAARLRGIADSGVGILLIDHDMSLVLGLCDYIYVIDFGRPLADGKPSEIRTNPDVVKAYLGTTKDENAVLSISEEPA